MAVEPSHGFGSEVSAMPNADGHSADATPWSSWLPGWRSLALVGTMLLLLAGCSSPTGSGPSPVAAQANWTWAIYNRTLATVAIGPALGLGPCAAARFVPGQPAPAGAAPASGAIALQVGTNAAPGYTRTVSIVVASDGTHVTIGEVTSGTLPACQGAPRP